MPRKTTRRDFLQGKSAADAMADLAQSAVDGDRPEARPGGPAAPSYLLRIARRAMACQFEVFLEAGKYANDTEAALEALDLVEALEEQLSVFRENSEVSRLNRAAAQGPTEVEPRLFDLLELACRLHAETQGAFDITSAPLSKAWGFSRRAGTVPTPQQLAEAVRRVGGHLVELDPKTRTVHFRRPGVELNLGSIGKGYALDRAAESLVAAGIDDFLLHGGQSSVLARGSRVDASGVTSDDPSGGWAVGLRHPLRRGTRLAEIRLHSRALATSGSGLQHFRHQGRRYGHILDPRTGRSAEGVISATVVAPSAAVADALSTAFYVMGAEAALEFCHGRPEIATLLVCPTARGTGCQIRTAGLPEDDLTILAQP